MTTMPQRVLSKSIWLALAASFSAQAQEVTQPYAADQRATLGTIIVTAEKRSEDIRQVPISISEIDAEQLEPRTIGIGFDAKF